MVKMGQTPMERIDVLKQMISEYRTKVATYQAMIGEWERELGLPPSAYAANGSSLGSDASGLTVEVQPWQFMGKSQPEAAKALLGLVKHPLTTEEIVDGIRRGGVEVKGKKNTFYAILNRSDEFARFGRNTWGLTDWPGRKTARKKREKKIDASSTKTARTTEKSKDNIGVAVREVMKDGKLRSKEQIVKAVEQRVGHAIKPIAVFGTLRSRKEFAVVDGQYRMAG
jgi:DNA-directed RNA polymerase delta subunit